MVSVSTVLAAVADGMATLGEDYCDIAAAISGLKYITRGENIESEGADEPIYVYRLLDKFEVISNSAEK